MEECKVDLKDVLKQSFGFDSFRPFQEQICQDVIDGHDTLVVMPTGAGKSLCYQLPTVVRGGVALVISPLIALIEDQVQKLQKSGLKAECLHSGMSREKSRDVCLKYKFKQIQFLYIAPERLAQRSFVDFIQKYPPNLLVIDEAHCISQWGHDFRPEYRRIGENLSKLPKTPVIAVTATATPSVQEDIVLQLKLNDVRCHIHGFRRNNLGIDILELGPKPRLESIRLFLKDPENTPAIVYASSRKFVEKIASYLQSDLQVAPYHAGFRPDVRRNTQDRFLSGKLDVLVATVAFGMGIDKADIRSVVHAGLPSSVEAYYQEIGRAGRDGKFARALTFHSASDRKTHEYLFEVNYPQPTELSRVLEYIKKGTNDRKALRDKTGHDEYEFTNILEKLWIHGAVSIDEFGEIQFISDKWFMSYVEQRKFRRNQLFTMMEYVSANRCRMIGLVKHFGDINDSGDLCGVCDFCLSGKGKSISFAKKKRKSNHTPEVNHG